MRTSLLIPVALGLAATAVAQAPRQVPVDDPFLLLRARANRPLQAARSGTGSLPGQSPRGPVAVNPLPGGILPGLRLAYMDGGDNAECVRAIPDVTGDGLDEIVVGIGESGTPNLFCLDGASRGAATVVWDVQTDGGLSGGSCYGDQAIVPISDTESSGDANILVGTAWGGRTAFDRDTALGDEVWRYDTYLDIDSGWIYSLCELSDITGDGTPDYAFGSGSDGNGVYAVDGASADTQATLLWRYPAGDAVYSVRNIGDANGDGTDDVLAAVGDDIDRIVCLEGDTTLPLGNVLWTYSPGASVFACDTLKDVTGDGIDEAIAVLWTTAGTIRCIDGADGTVVWTNTSVASFGMMVDELADVNGNGANELVVSSWDNAVSVIDGDDGSLIWKTTVGTLNGGDVWTARAIGDLNGDGKEDVIAGSFDYHVYAMDGVDGHVLWAFDTGNRVFSVYPVGDLNGDGRPEVVAGCQDTTNNRVVHVLDGDSGIP